MINFPGREILFRWRNWAIASHMFPDEAPNDCVIILHSKCSEKLRKRRTHISGTILRRRTVVLTCYFCGRSYPSRIVAAAKLMVL